MSSIIYNIFLLLYRAGIRIASLVDTKAGKWLSGRKNIFKRLTAAIPPGTPITWFHCASLGEFEQGRPVLEKIKRSYPDQKILLTFFSPSGYEVRKNYQHADWVFYLPIDGPRNAKRFLDIVNPTLAIFVKYELWYYYLKNLKDRQIPVLLISALFRRDKLFFKWYGGFHRKMLQLIEHLFVQDEKSKKLLNKIGVTGNCTVSGDTRFDRVVEIAEINKELEVVKQFATGNLLIAGSTWKEDELLLADAFRDPDSPGFNLVIAPHEIGEKNLRELKKLFPGALLYSDLDNLEQPDPSARVLIIDNIGMLAYLYKYADMTYVGGGFKTGLHNVLEAAVHNKIVFFGPLYKKHNEAVGLVESGGGIPINEAGDLVLHLRKLLADHTSFSLKSRAAGEFVRSHTGATQKIMNYIQEKRLLTS